MPANTTPPALEDLIGTDDREWRITLLLPVGRTPEEARQGPIRLKNLVAKAERKLEAVQAPRELTGVLAQARKRVNDDTYWRHQREGLALFLSSSGIRDLAVGQTLEEHAVVARRFFLLPILAHLEPPRVRYYLLAFSPNRVRFFRGWKERLELLSLPELPEDFHAIEKFLVPEKSLQFHTGTTPRGAEGSRAAIFHGHGAAAEKDRQKVRLKEFCRAIDRGLRPVLARASEPLVLACDRSLASLFAETVDYPHLRPGIVEGNPDELKESELMERARKACSPSLIDDVEQVVKRFEESAHEATRIADLAQILPAAFDGRVESLLLREHATRSGSYDVQAREPIPHAPEAEKEDLYNLCAIQTLRAGGRVHIIPADLMPKTLEIGAMLRY